MTLLGIRIHLACGVKVWAGFYLHRYAFDSVEDAQEFIADHWSQFTERWRKSSLTVAPLPPFVIVPGHYLHLRKNWDQ